MPRLHELTIRATHNSYEGGVRGSILQQLDAGIRGIELDVHNTGFAKFGDFRVGHTWVGKDVDRTRTNPDSLELTTWLRSIAQWSVAHPGHLVITLLIDAKEDFSSAKTGDIDDLERIVRDGLGDRLVPADAFDVQTEDVGLVAGRILVVLSGNENTRRAYLGREQPVLHVENQFGNHASLEQAPFYSIKARRAAKNLAWVEDAYARQKIVRLWGFAEPHTSIQSINYPACDQPFASWYDAFIEKRQGVPALDAATVEWGPEQRLFEGRSPTVAVVRNGDEITFALAYEDSAEVVCFALARLREGTLLVDHNHPNRFGQGTDPALGAGGGSIVLAYRARADGRITTHLGSFEDDNTGCAWSEAQGGPKGRQPAVALVAGEIAVAVHRSGRNNRLWRRWGRLAGEMVHWTALTTYDRGAAPCLAADDAVLWEVHKSETKAMIWARGVPAVENIGLDTPNYALQRGWNPAVAANDGMILCAFEGPKRGSLSCRVGAKKGEMPVFSAESPIGSGCHPAICLADDGRVLCVYEHADRGVLHYRLGRLERPRQALFSG